MHSWEIKSLFQLTEIPEIDGMNKWDLQVSLEIYFLKWAFIRKQIISFGKKNLFTWPHGSSWKEIGNEPLQRWH